MSCYHPLTGLRSLTPNPDTGKYPVRIIKTEYENEKAPFEGENYIPIPCGKCIGCRLDYSRTWADRCMCEASYYKDNIFLTLTYDDNHLPKCRKGSNIHSLVKKDLQKFMKDLRSHLTYEYNKTHDKSEIDYDPPKVRFYACGEYGDPSKSFRPHYHLILFGYAPEDMSFFKRKNGFDYYTSDTIAKIWNKGFHLFSDVSWDTCAYVARYVVKKHKGQDSDIYKKLNYEPEFTLMSRRPGIGKKFYEDHNDIVVNPVYLSTKDGHKTVRSNRYYDKLFDIEYPNDLEFIKKDRTISALQSMFLKQELTSLDSVELRHSDEVNKLAQMRALSRKEV